MLNLNTIIKENEGYLQFNFASAYFLNSYFQFYKKDTFFNSIMNSRQHCIVQWGLFFISQNLSNIFCIFSIFGKFKRIAIKSNAVITFVATKEMNFKMSLKIRKPIDTISTDQHLSAQISIRPSALNLNLTNPTSRGRHG